jgi:hypothetical protein
MRLMDRRTCFIAQVVEAILLYRTSSSMGETFSKISKHVGHFMWVYDHMHVGQIRKEVHS